MTIDFSIRNIFIISPFHEKISHTNSFSILQKWMLKHHSVEKELMAEEFCQKKNLLFRQNFKMPWILPIDCIKRAEPDSLKVWSQGPTKRSGRKNSSTEHRKSDYKSCPAKYLKINQKSAQFHKLSFLMMGFFPKQHHY